MEQGVRLAEREEGYISNFDGGNFIHAVLQKLAATINDIQTSEALENSARAIANNLLATPQYSHISSSKRGAYTAERLVEDSVKVSLAVYEQLQNSLFKVKEVELKSNILIDDVHLYGRIDRVDTFGDMVRVIDYKSGRIENESKLYYMGLKMQLPLYLLAASKGKRAIGAYYFPAQVSFKDELNGAYRMEGFMDGSEDVVRASDTTLVEPKEKSNYIQATLSGGGGDMVMSADDFNDFLQYSMMVARRGASELIGGNLTPSPVNGGCEYCHLAGCCGFVQGSSGEYRDSGSVPFKAIAEIVRKERGDK
jgi:ATP-dependent helicase/DNAse subunit B